jgi:hypothetical protein
MRFGAVETSSYLPFGRRDRKTLLSGIHAD